MTLVESDEEYYNAEWHKHDDDSDDGSDESGDGENSSNESSDDDDAADNNSEPNSDDAVDDANDDDSDDDVVILSAKRKYKAKGTPLTLHHTLVSYATTVAALPRKITYSVSVFSLEQMGMKRSSRGPPANDIIILDDNEPWDTLQAQILKKISVAVNPSTLNFADYRITFTVPRQVTTPLPLNSLKYPYLVENALISKTKASAKVLVEPIVSAEDIHSLFYSLFTHQ
jgi:hypothetical protein